MDGFKRGECVGLDEIGRACLEGKAIPLFAV